MHGLSPRAQFKLTQYIVQRIQSVVCSCRTLAWTFELPLTTNTVLRKGIISSTCSNAAFVYYPFIDVPVLHSFAKKKRKQTLIKALFETVI